MVRQERRRKTAKKKFKNIQNQNRTRNIFQTTNFYFFLEALSSSEIPNTSIKYDKYSLRYHIIQYVEVSVVASLTTSSSALIDPPLFIAITNGDEGYGTITSDLMYHSVESFASVNTL